LLHLIHMLGNKRNVEIEPEVLKVEYNCVESGIVHMNMHLTTVKVETDFVDGTQTAFPDKSLSFSWTKICHVPMVSGIYVGSDLGSVMMAVQATKMMGFKEAATHHLPSLSTDVVLEGKPTEPYHVKTHSRLIKGGTHEVSFYVHLHRNDSVVLSPAVAMFNSRILQVSLEGLAATGGNLSLANSPLELKVRFECIAEEGGTPVVKVRLPIQAPGDAPAELSFAFVKRCWPPSRLNTVFQVREASWAQANFMGAATVGLLFVGAIGAYLWKKGRLRPFKKGSVALDLTEAATATRKGGLKEVAGAAGGPIKVVRQHVTKGDEDGVVHHL